MYQEIINCIKTFKLEKVIERNKFLLYNSQNNLEKEESQLKKESNEEKPKEQQEKHHSRKDTRASDIAKLIENILQIYKQIITVEQKDP